MIIKQLTINQLNALVLVLNSTGEKITDNGTEKLVGRPLNKENALLRSSIIEQVLDVSRETLQKFKDRKGKKDQGQILDLLKKEIQVKFTKEEESLIRECVADFKGFTPDMADLVRLYA